MSILDVHRQSPDPSHLDRAVAQLETVEEFRHRIKVSRATVYNLLQRGMPSLSVGRARRIDPVTAMEWLREQSDNAA